MALKCGIVGLPNVGKSTLFNCLSSAKAQAANFPFCTIEPNVGVITVPDERLTRLAELVHPGRIVPATCEIVDIAGLVKGASKGEGLGNKFLGNIRETDAIIHVLRCFEDDNITHVDGTIDPIRDKEIIDTELQLKDLETIESRLAKTEKAAAAGNKDAKVELAVLKAYKEVLDQGKNARVVEFDTKDEQDCARNLFLLTSKPVLYVCNVAEQDAKDGNEWTSKVGELAKEEGAEMMVIAAKTEEDIAELESYDDKQLFLEELDRRYFSPKLIKILSVKDKFGYLYWDAETTSGHVTFIMNNPFSNIRVLDDGRIIMHDIDGNVFEIPDSSKLDKTSFKKIEIYL